MQVRAFSALEAEQGIDLEGPAITAGVTALARAGRMAEAEDLLKRHPPGVRHTPAPCHASDLKALFDVTPCTCRAAQQANICPVLPTSVHFPVMQRGACVAQAPMTELMNQPVYTAGSQSAGRVVCQQLSLI